MKRRIIQILSLLALHSSWGPQAKWLCTPVLSCHSCSLAWFACPVGVFVHYSAFHIFPWLALGTVLLVGVVFGRLFCGWVCPFGTLQDWLYKIRSPKFAMPAWSGWIKYAVLILLVLFLPWFLGEASWGVFCRYCPAAALQVTIPNLALGVASVSPATILRLGILTIVILAAIYSMRSFCKVFCPIGALLAPLNYISFWFVRMPEGCRVCGKCDKACTMDGKPSERAQRGIPPNRLSECIVCHECQGLCPENNNGKEKIAPTSES